MNFHQVVSNFSLRSTGAKGTAVERAPEEKFEWPGPLATVGKVDHSAPVRPGKTAQGLATQTSLHLTLLPIWFKTSCNP